jgi:signal transduction histidine kinase
VRPAGRTRSRRWRHSLRHSLRVRLIVVFVLLALAMSAVFLGGVQRAFSTGWRDAARPVVVDYMDRIVAELGTPPDVRRAQALVERLPISIRIEGPAVNWDSHPDRQRLGFGPRGDWLSRSTADGHRVSFGIGTLPWQREPQGIGWITLALLLALIALAYAYVRRLLRPLDDIRAGAERFGRGAFDTPIPLRRRDELGDLAQRINTMAHDIQAMLDAKRGLLLALSHELRSPLTRARLNAELLPATPEGAAERAALLRDLAEMRDLISDLLESERLASPHAALQREPVDLAALVREVVGEHPDGMRVVADLADGLPALALDRSRLKVLVRNLLDNALRHGAGAAQPPRIAVRRGEAGVELEVRDFGPGVAPAQLVHLTEPFYRTDGARQRATGGVGLGMYLCRLVAEAHGGRLAVRNAQPGLAVSVWLPGA